MDINKLKQANEIFQSLSSKTINEAMEELKTFDDIEYEVLRLVKSLINNSQHSDTRFEEDISQPFQSVLNKEWQQGEEVDGYELIELIGQGGMSVVFKAHRVNNAAQKPVAIKLFNLANQNPELKDRFKKEQRILSELSHPNVIDFHHGESTEQGDAYIVMELVDKGLPIDEYVKKNFINGSEVIDLLIQAADGLNYAHQHLVIHLDVKPSNLVVNQTGQLKVLDFGIAQLITSNSDEANRPQSEDKNNLIALTPTFASPEQIKAQSIDTSSDVFSLAAVAVLLLTGKQPFPSDRLMNVCAGDEAHVLNLLMTRLDDKDLRNILLKALNKDRSSRYEDMSAFRQDLKSWQLKMPVSASKNTWWYRFKCFVARRTAFFIVSLLLLLTLMLGVSLLGFQNKAIKHEADKANAVKQFMLDAFSVTDPDTAQGVEISAKELLYSATNKIAADKNMDESIKVELYVAMALANGRLGYYPEAIKLLDEARLIQSSNEEVTGMLAQYLLSSGEMTRLNQLLASVDEVAYASQSDQITILRVRAVVAAEAGEYVKALGFQNQIAAFDLSEHNYIRNQALLAEIRFLEGQSEQSVALIEAVKKSHPLKPTDVLNIGLNSDLVQYHDRNGNYKAAMKLTSENIQIFKTILGDSHPDLGFAYNALSAFQWLDGQLDDSLQSAAVSEKIFRERFGDRSEGLAQSLSNTGLAYYYQKQYDLAIDYLTKSTDMLAEIFGSEHPETMNAKANLATILNATGHTEKALPILQEMYVVESKTLGKSHRSTLYTQQSLALALAKSGQFDAAIQHAIENHELMSEHFSERKGTSNHSNSILARVYFMAGEHKLAIQYNLKYINDWSEGNENNLAQSYYLVAKSHFELKAYEDSFDYFEQWTEKMKSLYTVKDSKYLESLLTVAEFAQKADKKELFNQRVSEVEKILKDGSLDLPSIREKIKELSG